MDSACIPGAEKTELTEAVTLLERETKDPACGLPEEVFRLVSGLVPMVNVDLLIRNKRGQTLLTWREDGVYPPGWHIPGGIVRFKESMAARIRAVAMKELGVRVSFNPMPLAMTEVVATRRRVRGHFISFLYACALTTPLSAEQQADKNHPRTGDWAWHDGCPADFLSCQRRIYGVYVWPRRRSRR